MVNLLELVSRLNQGFYVTPEIQRGYVWGNPQVRDLFDSIYSEYPIGAIVAWEMPNTFAREFAEILTTLVDGLSHENRRYLIVDGRQRLTSLLLVTKGEIKLGGEVRRIGLYFDPAHEEFRISKGARFESDPAWFSVTELLREDVNDVLLAKQAKCGIDVSRNPLVVKRLGELKLRVGRYDVPILEANLGDPTDFPKFVERLSDIFVTLNRTGTRITLSDLVLALLTGAVRREEGKSFRELFERLTSELASLGFRMDEASLIRTFMAISTGLTRFGDSRRKLEDLSGGQILDRLKETGESVKLLVKLLRDELGLRGSDELYSRYNVVPLSYAINLDFLSKHKALLDDDVKAIRKWLIGASIKGRYTGELERLLSDDVEAIKLGKGWPGLMANLGPVSVMGSYLTGDPDRGHRALFSILLRENGATDWNDVAGRPVRVSEIANDKIDLHHIFPKDYMRKVKFKNQELVNDLANLTVISKDANLSIGSTPPSTYLPALLKRDKDTLRLHFVPEDPRLWEPRRYAGFLAERRRLIGEALSRISGFPFHPKE